MARSSTTPTQITGGAESRHHLPVLSLIRLAMQRHTAMFMSNMVGDLTQTQFATMARLLETGPCSQNQLGRLVYLDASTINGVVGRLKARGLIQTHDDPHDIRLSILSLSRKGRRITQSAIDVASRVNDETLQSLTREERGVLAGLLRKLGHLSTVTELPEPKQPGSRGRRSKRSTIENSAGPACKNEGPANGHAARRTNVVKNTSDAALRARR